MKQKDDPPLERTKRARRKKREWALILPCLGVFLFISPVLNIFSQSFDNASNTSVLPVLIFIFGIWAALIFGAYLLARALSVQESQADDAP